MSAIPDTDLEQRRVLYEAILRAHEARGAEIQSQQARIASVLAATGFVFAFVGTSAPLFFRNDTPVWPASACFLTALVTLGLGIVAGAVSLLPMIPPWRPLYLDVGALAQEGSTWTTGELLATLIDSLAQDAARRPDKLAVIKRRRAAIYIQLCCLGAGGILLVTAIIFRFLAP